MDVDKLWRQMVDHKYNNTSTNIFCSGTTIASSLFKWVIWAASIAKMGYTWKIGNDKKVILWEDNWLGPSSLAIQFWEICILVNEKSHPVCDLWDGTKLKCTFRRGVDSWLMNLCTRGGVAGFHYCVQ